MWFKKYWPAILGVVLQAGSVWKLLKWALDWRGRYDALAATYHDAGGASAVIGYVLDPPPWFYPASFIAGCALMWWNFRRLHPRKLIPGFSPKEKNDLDFLLHTLSTKLGGIEHQLGAFDKFQNTRWTKDLGQHRYELEQIRNGINDFNGDIFFNFLPQNREYFSYLIRVLESHETLSGFHSSATEYLDKLGAVRPIDPERVPLVDAANEHLIKSAADVREWLSGAKTRLAETRKSLR